MALTKPGFFGKFIGQPFGRARSVSDRRNPSHSVRSCRAPNRHPQRGNRDILKPDFLVISAPRTGTHWLRANLNGHARVSAIGENLWFYDLCLPYHQFTRYFVPGQVNGDITPMYCLLTRRDVARVQGLLPNCKLVILLRDPVSRAWSHIKHMERHQESVFAKGETDYFKAAQCPYALIHGDYLGTVNRWLSAFPRSSLLIRFYEAIRHRPHELLNDLFNHIGVEAQPGLRLENLNQVINEDPSQRQCPPVLEKFLQQVYRKRTQELVDTLHLNPPSEWDRTLRPPAQHDLDFWTYTDYDIEQVKVDILKKWLP